MLPNKLLQMLSGIDAKKMKEGIHALSEFSKTQEGLDFLEQFKGLSSADLLKKIEDTKQNPEKLEDFSKTLQNLDQESLLTQLSNNPDLLQKMRDYLNQPGK
ncbi:MAG: hypothetical protein H7Y41_01485 [Hyphomonadaceae bacterium]|nr:hypothetical protein [Clostridia bacterium]